MPKVRSLFLFLLVASLAGNPFAEACGDKLMAFGKGLRFQRAFLAARPASILIYARQGQAGASLRDSRFQSALKQVGHKFLTVENATQLDEALRSGAYDLVLADVADAGAVAPQALSARGKPLLVPVAYKPTKELLAAVKRQYPVVLKAPGDPLDHLTSIDEAMKRRG